MKKSIGKLIKRISWCCPFKRKTKESWVMPKCFQRISWCCPFKKIDWMLFKLDRNCIYSAHSNHFDKPMREKKRQFLIEKISCCCPFVRADHTIWNWHTSKVLLIQNIRTACWYQHCQKEQKGRSWKYVYFAFKGSRSQDFWNVSHNLNKIWNFTKYRWVYRYLRRLIKIYM